VNLRQLVALGACLRSERERVPTAAELTMLREQAYAASLPDLAALVSDESNEARLDVLCQVVVLRTGALADAAAAPGFPPALPAESVDGGK